ncbi:hypothetical protein DV735_g3701, partial [Chaetothyriales sp. CBS 134920]
MAREASWEDELKEHQSLTNNGPSVPLPKEKRRSIFRIPFRSKSTVSPAPSVTSSRGSVVESARNRNKLRKSKTTTSAIQEPASNGYLVNRRVTLSDGFERDKQTGEIVDHTEMLHILGHSDNNDYNNIPFVPLGQEEGGTEDGQVVVDKLPRSIWNLVLELLPTADKAALSLSCHAFQRLTGTEPLAELALPDEEYFREKLSFLPRVDRQFPHHLLCFDCGVYHVRTQRGSEALQPNKVLNPLYNCPNLTNPKKINPRIRITFTRNLPLTFVQLTMRAHRFSPEYGIHPDSLSRRYKDREHVGSTWSHQLKFLVVKGHLLMRVTSQTFAPAGLPPAGERHLLYSQEDFIPLFSVCPHWRDGVLMPSVKCAIRHIPKPLEGSGVNRLAKEIKKHYHPDNPVVSLCSECRPMRRCPNCPTEYLIEVKMAEDRSDPTQLFKQALVVTRWSDLGDGTTPFTPEWSACCGTNDEYDSFATIGGRAVSGRFEGELNPDAIPPQNMKSLNPENQHLGEKGHDWDQARSEDEITPEPAGLNRPPALKIKTGCLCNQDSSRPQQEPLELDEYKQDSGSLVKEDGGMCRESSIDMAHHRNPRDTTIHLRRKTHVDLFNTPDGFDVHESCGHKPVATNWPDSRKRFTAIVVCINTACLGILIGIYAGEVPAIQYQVADFGHMTILGNVCLYLGLAITTLVCWPLPLLHGRKPYTLAGLAFAFALQIPQGIAVSQRRLPSQITWRLILLLCRALTGIAFGFVSINVQSSLLDVFGASLQSRHPHGELTGHYDSRRDGGGMGLWLGAWSWCTIGPISLGFVIGAFIISTTAVQWGFWVGLFILMFAFLLNLIAPETRRSAFRRTIAEMTGASGSFCRVARGEVKMHLKSPGFLILALYSAWTYAQFTLVMMLMGALTSRQYQYRPALVGICSLSLGGGAILAVPFQKASIFSRSRSERFRTDSMTFQRSGFLASHTVRRILFTRSVPVIPDPADSEPRRWEPIILGNPSGMMRKINLLEAGTCIRPAPAKQGVSRLHWRLHCSPGVNPTLLLDRREANYTADYIARPAHLSCSTGKMDNVDRGLERAEVEASRTWSRDSKARSHSEHNGALTSHPGGVHSRHDSFSSSSAGSNEANMNRIATASGATIGSRGYRTRTHPIEDYRTLTHRLQQVETVGARGELHPRKSKTLPLPEFGGGKPYPPQLPEQEQYVVEFDGVDDPLHPQNWPFRKNIEVTTLGTSLFVLGFAFGPLIWGPASELKGRKLPIMIAEFGFICFCFASATSKDIQTLMICRFWNGIFGSCPLSVVASVFADMYNNTHRGIAIVVFAAMVFMGPMFGPFIGGFINKSYLHWRWNLYLPAIMASFALVLIVLFVSETYAPVILVSKAAELRRRTKNWGIHAKQEEIEIDLKELVSKNFSRPIRLLISEPIILLVTIYMSFIYSLLYVFLTAYPLVFQGVHGMVPGVAGLPFFGMVVGILLVASYIVLTNNQYAKKLEANDGIPVPEWRLPPVVVGGVLFGAGLLWFGWSGYKKDVHWIVPTLSGLFTGFGLLAIFIQLFNYIIDSYIMFSASAIAANTFMRSALAAGFPLFARQMFNNLGIEWAGTLLGCLALICVPIPICFMLYGKKLRQRSKFGSAMSEPKEDGDEGADADQSAENAPDMIALHATRSRAHYDLPAKSRTPTRANGTAGGPVGGIDLERALPSSDPDPKPIDPEKQV